MPTTSVRGRQLRDDDVTRADLNVTTAGSAVIRRVIAGSGVSISSTGVDTGTGDVTISLSASAVTGSGTTNYVSKFTGTGTLGNSQIFDNGSSVGISTTSPSAKLHVVGEIIRTNTRISTGQVFPVGHYTPGETVFEINPAWSQAELQAYFNSSNVSWVAVTDAPGGYAIYIAGAVNVGGPYNSGFPFIPVDADDMYYMECWIQNVGTGQAHYMGSADYDHTLSNPSGNPGTYGYWVMSNTNPGNTWTKVSGYIRGFGTSTGQFKTGTEYWTPMALFNYTSGTGTVACRISGWKVIRVYQPGNRYFNGSIGIGTASPSARLHLAGAVGATTGITIQNGSATRLRLYHDDNAGASYLDTHGVGALQQLRIRSGDILAFDTGTTERARLIANGNFLIGTSTDSGHRLDVSSGTVRFTGRLFLDDVESANLFGIRGRFTNQYIHLFNKVGVGHPNGWGQGETDTPNFGFSSYGAINVAYGNNAASTFNGDVGIGGSPSVRLHVFGNVQIGSSAVNQISVRYTRTNGTIAADGHYFVASLNTPVQSWIEGGFMTGERAGTVTAPNSGYPYYEEYTSTGSDTSKLFGFINLTTGNFTGTNILGALRLIRTGQLRLPQYTSTTSFTGTVVAGLGVDSSGNLITTTPGGVSGSGTTNVIPKFTSATALGNSTISDNGTTVSVGANLFVNSVDDRAFIVDAGGNSRLGIVKKFGSEPVFAASSGNPMRFGHWSTAQIEGNVASGTFTERIRITSTGLVGINTTTPNTNLHVVGTAEFSNTPSEVRITNSDNANRLASLFFNTLGGPWTVESNNDLTIKNANPGAAITTGSYLLLGRLSGFAAIGTNATERIRITSAGDVGIGTTSPGYKLDVNGSFRSSGIWTTASAITFWGGGTTATPTAFGGLTWDTGYAAVYALSGNALRLGANGRVSNPDIFISTSGNVGIGTNSPNVPVEIYRSLASTTTAQQMLTITTDFGSAIGTGFGGSIVFRGRTAGNLLQDNAQILAYNEDSGDNGYALSFFTRPSSGAGLLQRLTILRNGNVGIGTTAPTTTLQVSASSVNSSSLRIGQTTLTNNALGTWTGLEFTLSNEVSQLSGNPASRISSYLEAGNNMFGLQFWTRNDASTFTEKVRITAVGNVGINTVSPSYRLDVNGTLRSVNDAYFATTNGSVGIGTTSPSFTSGTGLHIRVAGDAVMRVTAGARTGFDVAQETVGGLVYLFNRDNTDVIIAINDGEKARFKPNGQLYLGAVPAGGYGASFLFQTSGGLYVQQTVRFNNLAGTGTRVVVASSDGTLSTDTLTAASVGATSGNGTTNYVTKYTGTSTLGNSQIFDNATNVGIGTASPEAKLHIANLTSNNTAYQHISYISANNSTETSNESYTNSFPSFGLGFRRQWSSGTFTNIAGIYAFGSGGWRGGLLFRTKDNITSTGEPDINALYLSPIGRMGVNTTDPSQVLDVNGRIRARTIDTNGSPTFYLTADANGVIQRTSGIPSGGGTVNGSGTTGYVPRWTSSTAIGNSVIFDAGGTNIGVAIGHTTPYSPGGHASLHIGGYNSGRGLITFGWGAANAGPAIYSNNDDSLSIQANSYVSVGPQLRTTKLMVNTSTDSGHDAHVQGSLAVTGFIRVYRDSGYGLKNFLVNDDGFVFLQMQSNDQLNFPRPCNFASTVRFGLFEWYPSYQTGNNWANIRIGASSNGGTRHEFVFNFEGELRSQNWNGNLIGYTGHVWMGNADVRGFYFAPSQVTGSTSLLYAWENTMGHIKFGNLAGSGTRMVVCDSNGVLSTQSIPGGGGGNTIYSGDGTLSGQRVITAGGNNIRLSNGGFLVSNTANTQRVEHLFDGIYSVGVDLTLFAPSNQNLIFYSGNGPAGRFTATKNFLIGTSVEAGDALLVVGGFGGSDATIQIGGSSTGYSSIYLGDGSGADRYAGYVQYYHATDELWFGTAKNTRVKINSSGRMDVTGDVVAFSSSDIRLKENINLISNPIEKVKQISGVSFNWKKEHLNIHGYTEDDVGVIAQEIQKILPEAVRKNDTGYYAVRYEKLIPLLIEAIKEQQSQIEELKKKAN